MHRQKFSGEYTYHASEADSKITARDNALNELRKKLLREAERRYKESKKQYNTSKNNYQNYIKHTSANTTTIGIYISGKAKRFYWSRFLLLRTKMVRLFDIQIQQRKMGFW
jgi:molecular chaperone GrpE (heat shock protein)